MKPPKLVELLFVSLIFLSPFHSKMNLYKKRCISQPNIMIAISSICVVRTTLPGSIYTNTCLSKKQSYSACCLSAFFVHLLLADLTLKPCIEFLFSSIYNLISQEQKSVFF